mmetsp:Transcript_6851/g.15690  ORF Transcript_6851/g.15690 Transcript_6851/m.15690 type:complete len:385 (+) Transcript_6851:131-1285(+)
MLARIASTGPAHSSGNRPKAAARSASVCSGRPGRPGPPPSPPDPPPRATRASSALTASDCTPASSGWLVIVFASAVRPETLATTVARSPSPPPGDDATARRARQASLWTVASETCACIAETTVDTAPEAANDTSRRPSAGPIAVRAWHALSCTAGSLGWFFIALTAAVTPWSATDTTPPTPPSPSPAAPAARSARAAHPSMATPASSSFAHMTLATSLAVDVGRCTNMIASWLSSFRIRLRCLRFLVRPPAPSTPVATVPSSPPSDGPSSAATSVSSSSSSAACWLSKLTALARGCPSSRFALAMPSGYASWRLRMPPPNHFFPDSMARTTGRVPSPFSTDAPSGYAYRSSSMTYLLYDSGRPDAPGPPGRRGTPAATRSYPAA